MSNLSPLFSCLCRTTMAVAAVLGPVMNQGTGRKLRGLALLLSCLAALVSCESPTSDKAAIENTLVSGDNTETLASERNTGLADSLLPTPLQLAYARALRMAEQGDPATLLLCDSLLANQGPRGGAEPYYYQGIYYTTKKQPQQAIVWFNKTIETDYTFFEAYLEKAALLMEANQYESALKELELLRTLSPGYAPVHYWLGKWAARQDKKQMAIHHYRLALSLDTSLIEARQALTQLEK